MKNPAAVALGRLGGKATSDAKTKARGPVKPRKKESKMKNTKSEIAVLEKIASSVMKTCKRPEIRGVGHVDRIKAPRKSSVFRILSYDNFSTGRGSRCGFTAKSLVMKVVERAAKKGIVWDWDGSIARKGAERIEEENRRIENEARAEAFESAGGEQSFKKWYAENPKSCGNCQTDENKIHRARRNYINFLMGK